MPRSNISTFYIIILQNAAIEQQFIIFHIIQLVLRQMHLR